MPITTPVAAGGPRLKVACSGSDINRGGTEGWQVVGGGRVFFRHTASTRTKCRLSARRSQPEGKATWGGLSSSNRRHHRHQNTASKFSQRHPGVAPHAPAHHQDTFSSTEGAITENRQRSSKSSHAIEPRPWCSHARMPKPESSPKCLSIVEETEASSLSKSCHAS